MGALSRIPTVFVTLLILMLPFHTSLVFGSALEVEDASGEDDIFDSATNIGYKRYMEEVSIILNAEFSGSNESVNRSNVQVQRGASGYFSVDSCSGGSPATCEMTNTIMSTGETSYSARLVDDSENTLRMTSFRIRSDNEAPQINSFSVTPEVSTSGDFTLDYDVSDYAYGSTDGVGLDTIWILVNDTVQQTISGDGDTNKADSITFSPSGGEGHYDICIKAKDIYGQNSSTECAYREIDTTAPSAENITVYEGSYNEIEYLSDEPTEGFVRVYFDSSDVEEDTIEADLSALTGETDMVSPDSCYDNGIVTRCRWDSITFQINDTLSGATAEITFEDEAGNSGQSTVTIPTIGYDATGPQFVSLETDHGQLSDGTWKVYQTNNFTLTLSERDLGGNLPSLDLSEIGAGSDVVADSCDQSGESYTCVWNEVDAPEYEAEKDETYTISTHNLSDDLDNYASELLAINVTVDTLGPTVEGTDVETHPQSGHEVYANRTVKGDILEVTSYIEDPGTQVSATANFSNLVNGSQSEAASCVNNGNQWNCTWTTDVITTDSIGDVSFSYTVTDDVGNTEEVEESVYVYGIMNNTDFDHWEHSVTCSPDLLDRQVTEFQNLRSYCSVQLSPATGGGAKVHPIDVEVGQCQPRDNTSGDYVSEATFMNHGANSTNPIIRMELAAKKMDIDWINYSCEVNVLSEVSDDSNTYVTEFYESENVSVDLGFYNLPLGEYSDEMKEEIIDVKNDTWVAMEWIGKLQKVIDVMMQICDIIDLLVKIKKTWTAFQFAISWAEGNPWAQGVVETTKQGNQGMEDASKGFLKTFTEYCAYVTCDRTLWDKAEMVSPDLKKWAEGVGTWTDENALVISGGGSGLKKNVVGDEEGEVQKGDMRGHMQEDYTLTLDMFPGNPKESLLLSIGTLCIPGILDGIQRWRQIQCNYGICLVDSMRMNMPQTVCVNQKDYLECKYVAGEVFNLIPWVKSVQNLLSGLKNVLSNPLSMVFSVAGYVCRPQIHSAQPHAACLWSKIVLETTQIANMVKEYVDQGLGDIFSAESTDRCDEFNTKLEEVGLANATEDDG